MIIIGIDPGPVSSGVVFFDTHTAGISVSEVASNIKIRDMLDGCSCPHTVAIEMPASYGMSVGATILDTCVEVGRFIERSSSIVGLMFRKTIATEICGQAKAKGSMIRQSIIDMYGEGGIGGKKCSTCKGKGWFGAGRPVCTQCDGTGWKVPPGPLYNVTTHVWDALAVAIAYSVTKGYLTPLAVTPEGLGKNFQQPAHGYPTGTGLNRPTHQGGIF